MRTLVAVAALALVLTGCGGGDVEQAAAPETVAPVDLGTAGDALEAELGVECDDEIVDGMGLGKVVCTVPEGHDVEEGVGMAVQSFTTVEDGEMFRDTFAGEGFVMGDGWFVNAPSQEIAEQAAAVLQ